MNFKHTACTFPGCGRPHEAHGLCASHDAQRRRGSKLHPIGNPNGGRRPWSVQKANLEQAADHEPATPKLIAKVEVEVAAGIRCRCYLLMPCRQCLPTRADDYLKQKEA